MSSEVKKAITEPNPTEPKEITEPTQPSLCKLADNDDDRYRVLAPWPVRWRICVVNEQPTN